MFLYFKMCHRPMNKDLYKACTPGDSFMGIHSFSFPFLIYMMPKKCSQGYHFSVAVCKSGELRRFIFLTHLTKTMSCRIVVSNRGGTEGGHTQPSLDLLLKNASGYKCDTHYFFQDQLSLPC